MPTATGRNVSLEPADRRARYERLFADLDGPFAFVDLDAMWSNSRQMLGRSGSKPIRVASKSLRSTGVTRRIFASNERYQGQLTFTLPETLWLAEQGFEDLVLAYPSVDRAALRQLARVTAESPDGAPVVMVDSVDHLNLIESLNDTSAPVRVAIEVDAGYWAVGGRVKLGPKRSPIHTPEQAVAFAQEIVRRQSVTLAGMMFYEGQIAGLGDNAPGPLSVRARNMAIHQMQKLSIAELAERRAKTVALVSEISELEFVNGGG